MPRISIEDLQNAVRGGGNHATRLAGDVSLSNAIASLLLDQCEASSSYIEAVHQLSSRYDYRLAAALIWAKRTGNEVLYEVLMALAATSPSLRAGRLQYDAARLRSPAMSLSGTSTHFIDDIDDLLTCSGSGVYICAQETIKPQLKVLLEDIRCELSNFIEAQDDVPGRNALVRQGLVKEWFLPNGTAVISKKQNFQKPGRFEQEQYNYRAIEEKIPNLWFKLEDDGVGGKITVRIARPDALIADGASGTRWAISMRAPGVSLEELLLNEPLGSPMRRRYLAHYRSILDALYDHGIVWRDMSPRNILVDCRDNTIIGYTLIDFEKSIVVDGSVPTGMRVEHCRGQVCIEEMCVLCPLEEVTACFSGYFDPSDWDMLSATPQPKSYRPDIADILAGRGGGKITVGQYNQLDQDIIRAKSPVVNDTGSITLFPGSIGFKVEHYLSCAGYPDAGDYDRKTTEVLLAARTQHCFKPTVKMLLQCVDRLEAAMVIAELQGIIETGTSARLHLPKSEIAAVTSLLDAFYTARNKLGAYRTMARVEERVMHA